MPNRLSLDFGIETSEARNNFIKQYITRPEFSRSPLTQDELETISNYILWGKDSDGLNCTQRKEIQIETRNKTWQRDDTESLDALMESPTFNEVSIHNLSFQPKTIKKNFDRAQALKECPPHMYNIYKDLFKEIDTIELAINYYELAHKKRKTPPRDFLLNRFSPQEQEKINKIAEKWTQQKYLKMRHLIVELRREQFTLRDTYTPKISRHQPAEPEFEESSAILDIDYPVFPLGLINSSCAPLIFPTKVPLAPSTYTHQQLKTISQFYWTKKQTPHPKIFFDFENPTHLYKLINYQEELAQDPCAPESSKAFLDTLDFYVRRADLSDIYREILDMKINKKKNQDIVDEICARHNKKYTVNYISTIFKQKIIPKIIQAVQLHSTIIANLSFNENFKKCNTCGEELLISTENFVRKARSKDGYSNRCKRCDKLDRQRREVGK